MDNLHLGVGTFRTHISVMLQACHRLIHTCQLISGTLTHTIFYALGMHNINIDMSKDCPFGTSIHIICYATGMHHIDHCYTHVIFYGTLICAVYYQCIQLAICKICVNNSWIHTSHSFGTDLSPHLVTFQDKISNKYISIK